MAKKKYRSTNRRVKKSSKKLRVKQRISFDYFRWLSIGFGIASVGIAIAGILFLITSVNK